ncbi:hypothetical protein D3C75_935890 [compost metagenome]
MQTPAHQHQHDQAHPTNHQPHQLVIAEQRLLDPQITRLQQQFTHGLVRLFQRHPLQLPGRVGETAVLVVSDGAPIVVGQRTVALYGPGLAGDRSLLQAVEGVGIEAVPEQSGLQVVEHLFGLGHVVTLKVGIEAHETHAAEHFALRPRAIGQTMSQAQLAIERPIQIVLE